MVHSNVNFPNFISIPHKCAAISQMSHKYIHCYTCLKRVWEKIKPSELSLPLLPFVSAGLSYSECCLYSNFYRCILTLLHYFSKTSDIFLVIVLTLIFAFLHFYTFPKAADMCIYLILKGKTQSYCFFIFLP